MALLDDNLKVIPDKKADANPKSPGPLPTNDKLPHKVSITKDDPRHPDYTLPKPLKESGYECVTFLPTSLRLITFFDPRIRTPPFTLHPWQCEVNEDISLGRTRDANGVITNQCAPTEQHPYKFALCAANGSGKDAFVIAPLALWFILTKIESKVIITSSSGDQLSSQTEHYIYNLADKINKWASEVYGQKILKVVKRHITCLLSGSVIHMFATDQKEKAEGHHPTAPGREMMLIVNEAKSVTPDIFEALNRCTGFNYWVDVSSPGQPAGDFHFHFEHWPNKRRVTVFDCPHQALGQMDEDRIKYGEHSPHFRSKWLALFTYTDGKFVIQQQHLQTLRSKTRNKQIRSILQDEPIRIGIDLALSQNGDESVVSVWRGNTQLDQKEWHIQDSTILTVAIEAFLKKYVSKEHIYIFADDGGVGRAVIDQLNARGWRINRVLNNSATSNKKMFKNKGAKLWYKFARWVEVGVLLFKNTDDNKLWSQLASRKYKDAVGGTDVLQLEPKKDMISSGLPSPDRADATVLAFTDVPLDKLIDAYLGAVEAEDNKAAPKTKEELWAELKHMVKWNRGALFGNDNSSFKAKKVRGSLSVALSNQNRGHSIKTLIGR